MKKPTTLMYSPSLQASSARRIIRANALKSLPLKSRNTHYARLFCWGARATRVWGSATRRAFGFDFPAGTPENTPGSGMLPGRMGLARLFSCVCAGRFIPKTSLTTHVSCSATGKNVFGFIISGVMLALSAAGHLSAEQIEPPFDGPPIAPAPDAISYTITQTSAGEEAEKKRQEANPSQPMSADIWGHRIVQWKIVRTGKLTSVETTTKNGKTGAMWVVGGVEIVRAPGTTTCFINRSAVGFDPYHLDFGRYGFPFTEWIGRNNFDKIASLQGKKALHFTDKIKERDMDGATVIVDVEAWTDFTTRLPLCVKREDTTYSFQYCPDPEAPLELPGEVKGVLGNEVARLRRLTGIPPSP